MKLSFLQRSNERQLPADYSNRVLLWDIDKTYLDTHFSSWRGLLAIPLEWAVDKEPIAGAVALLRALRRSAAGRHTLAPLFFVSGSPPQLRPVVEQRMTLDGVQFDGITFKDQWGLMRARRPKDVKRQLGYKLKALLAYRQEVPAAARWWMFGDDVESDATTFTLFGSVCSHLRGDELEALLVKERVHARDREEIHALLEDIPTGTDPVEAIVIRCTRRPPPEDAPDRQFHCRSFAQAALLCLDSGLIDADDAQAIFRDVRRRGTHHDALREQSNDAVQRFGLGDKSRAFMKDVLQ